MATHFFPNGSIITDGDTSGGGCCGGVGGIGVTYNRASLKLIPWSDRPFICLIYAPETGVQKAYKWAPGDTSTPDDYSVIDPGDGTGMWLQYL